MKAFLPNLEDIKRDLDKLHNNDLNNLYSCPGIISGVIKSKIINGRHMCNACGRGEVHTGFWWGSPRERDNLEYLVDGRLDGYSRHRMEGRALLLSVSGEGKVEGFCEHGDEPEEPIECP